MNSSLDLDEVLARIVRHAVQLSETDGGSIMEFDEETERFLVRATYGTELDGAGAAAAHARSSSGTRWSAAPRCAGHPLQEPDLGAVQRDPHQQALFDAGWRSMLAVPLLRDERIVGILVVRRLSTGPFYSARPLTCCSPSPISRRWRSSTPGCTGSWRCKSAELEIASRHKSEFLASMSHELRTPLNAVIGFSEVLLERMYGELNDKQDEYLRDILGSGQHLLALLNDVLDLSKVEAGRMELDRTTFAVRGGDRRQPARWCGSAPPSAGIRLASEVAPEVPDVHADRLRIRQVIVNLLLERGEVHPAGGAVRVPRSGRGGEVEVAVVGRRALAWPSRIANASSSRSSRAAADASTRRAPDLGLTLSRRIVHLHGGRMWLDSEVGAGSTFGFAIPFAAVAADRAA